MRGRPNILLITTDQQRWDSLGCAGNPAATTPHLDALAAAGVLAERAYCPNPVCTPSRASIVTGRMPSGHGAWNVGVNLPGDNPSFAAELARHGYRTALIGKAHLQAWGAKPGESVEAGSGAAARFQRLGWNGPYYGFEHVELSIGHVMWGLGGHYKLWLRGKGLTDEDFTRYSKARLVAGEGQVAAFDWNLPLELHSSVWTAERAVAQLERFAASGEPFALWASFQDPHHPFAVPEPYDRPREGARELPFVEGELDDKPPHFRTIREGRLAGSPYLGEYPMAGQHTGQDYRLVGPEWAHANIDRYLGMVELMDHETGRILAALDLLGLAENTLVVFTSDHGELLGEHGIWMKGPLHYDGVLRVPLLARWPRGLPAGRSDAHLASLTDLAPTFLAAAGVPVPPEMDGGTSLLPQWRGEGVVRSAAFVECVDDPGTLDLATVVTATHKLTAYRGGAYAGREAEVGELYDLESDPGELVNRWLDPAYREVKEELVAMLAGRLPSRDARRMAPRIASV
ncbi:MAG TPA: sulfatase-like hydrolase/transferase [Deinococcales bacterium]|nr:sulfatase-like hydrolase/transferase [Deinococcales bacterium]